MILPRFVLGRPKRKARDASNPITIQGTNEEAPKSLYKYKRNPSGRLKIRNIPEIMKIGGSINKRKKPKGTSMFPMVSRLFFKGRLCSQSGAFFSGTNKVKKKNEKINKEIDRIKFNCNNGSRAPFCHNIAAKLIMSNDQSGIFARK